jgi:hypothetical protein
MNSLSLLTLFLVHFASFVAVAGSGGSGLAPRALTIDTCAYLDVRIIHLSSRFPAPEAKEILVQSLRSIAGSHHRQWSSADLPLPFCRPPYVKFSVGDSQLTNVITYRGRSG